MAKEKNRKSRIKHNILAIAIAIIFVMFVGYGIETFYDSPDYSDFCDERSVLARFEEPQELNKSYFEECREEYDSVREPYNRNVFIIALVIGMIAIIVGGVILSIESVGSGIMGGGVLLVIYGTMRYWGEMSKYIRIIILGLVLAVLIWIGYKKLRN